MRKPRSAAAATSGSPNAGSVDAFFASCRDPRVAEWQALRRLILAVDPAIAEGIKWNAPSFRTGEHFATFHLRAKHGVQVILHLGAKPRPQAAAHGIAVEDPQGLLKWLAKDRAAVAFRDLTDIAAKEAAFVALIRAWIRHL